MTFFLPRDFKLVDQMVLGYTPRIGQVILNDKALAKARTLGQEVTQAIKLPPNEVQYLGGINERSCPLCHQNLFVVQENYAQCPLCGIKGKLEVAGNKIKVVFDEQSLLKDRFSTEMTKEHLDLVESGHKTYEEKKQEIKNKLKKYQEFLPYTLPPSRKS
jgi:hypothetical protein